MKSKNQWKEKLRKIKEEERNSVTEKELFTSAQLKNYLEKLSRSFGHPTPIEITDGGETGPAAFTTGAGMVINYSCGIIQFYESPIMRFRAFLGLFFHEKAHEMYLDFDREKEVLNALERGNYTNIHPKDLSTQEETLFTEMMNDWVNTALGPALRKAILNLSNIVSDVHDEEKIMKTYPNLTQAPIHACRNSLLASIPLWEETQKQVDRGEMTELCHYFNLFLQCCRFGFVAAMDPKEAMQKESFRIVMEERETMEKACRTDSTEEKYRYLLKLMLRLYPILKKEYGRKEGRNRSSDPLDRILGEMEKGRERSGGSEPMQGKTSASTAGELHDGDGLERDGSNMTDSSEELLGKLLDGITEEKVQKKLGNEQKSAIEAFLKKQHENGPHGKVALQVTNAETDERSRAVYRERLKENEKTLQRLVRKLRRELSDSAEGMILHGRIFGERLTEKDLYRRDRRIFSTKKLPTEVPTMAIGLLIDRSGSMRGERIDCAINAAVLLQEFALKMEYPVCVMAHSASEKINLILCKSFDSPDEKDKYRVCAIKASGCNRDGAALSSMIALMEQRGEEHKVLFVITDGKPHHIDYEGEEAKKAELVSMAELPGKSARRPSPEQKAVELLVC